MRYRRRGRVDDALITAAACWHCVPRRELRGPPYARGRRRALRSRTITTTAAVCTELGAPLTVRDDWTLAEPGPGEVLVQTRAAGLNFARGAPDEGPVPGTPGAALCSGKRVQRRRRGGGCRRRPRQGGRRGYSFAARRRLGAPLRCEWLPRSRRCRSRPRRKPSGGKPLHWQSPTARRTWRYDDERV